MSNFPGRAGFESGVDEPTRRGLFDVERFARTRMGWGGFWDVGVDRYPPATVVNDDGWLAVCTEPTGCTERPAPQAVGESFYLYDGASPTESLLASQITFGNRYTWPTGGFLTGYRVYTIAGNEYTLLSVNDPDGAAQIEQLGQFLATATGWREFGLTQTIISSGTTFDLVAIVSEPDATPTVWTGNWDYVKPNNEGPPLTGQALQANRLPSLVSVHKTDSDAGDRGAELLALNVGDVIELGAARWSIQSITDSGTYVDFGVAPAVQSPLSGVQEFKFETVTPTPVTYMKDLDYWTTSSFPTTQGLFGTAYSDAVADDSAYGVDIQVQVAEVSDQWDIMSAPSSGGTGTNTSGFG